MCVAPPLETLTSGSTVWFVKKMELVDEDVRSGEKMDRPRRREREAPHERDRGEKRIHRPREVRPQRFGKSRMNFLLIHENESAEERFLHFGVAMRTRITLCQIAPHPCKE